MDRNPRHAPEKEEDELPGRYVEGVNPVFELLKSGRSVDKLFIAQEAEKRHAHLAALARKNGAAVVVCDRRKLDRMSTSNAHQGVIASAAAVSYATVQDILALAGKRGEKPLIVICDGITDPHNLGAIIRSAEVAGAHGVVIGRHRSAGLNTACFKAAAGALEYIPVARVTNIRAEIDALKECGIWIYAADAKGTKTVYEADLRGPAAVVIGSEGEGVSRLVLDGCDFTVSIPVKGRISSLNASAAAAVMLFETVRQRSCGGGSAK